MSCTDCSNTDPISFTGSFFPGSPCTDNPDCSGAPINGVCVYYNGPNLSCSGILTLDSVETALMKIDAQICAIIGDYSTYTMNCLPDWWESSITTQAVFVDAITSFTCNIYETLNTFIDVTYAADLTDINNEIAALQIPAITCSSASVTNTDTLVQILTKYCTKFGEIDDAMDITSVDWNNCFTVVSPPTTIAGGFQLTADQICLLYNMITDGDALPTFNNYTNCLAGTSSDSLVTTIGLIITKLCAAPVFDNDDLTSTCITIPGDSTDLSTLIQNILDAVDSFSQNYVTFDGGDFTVTATNPMDPCAGITVALASPPTTDRFVAVSASDASPSTLIAKIASAAGSIAVTNNANTTLNLEIATGDRGDITVSAAGLTWTIDNDVVTFAKMQNISTQKLLGRSTVASGDVEEISIGTGLTLSAGVLFTTDTLFTFENGLTETSGLVHLGGPLVENTDINGVENTYNMSFSSINTFSITALDVALTAGAAGSITLSGKLSFASSVTPTQITSNTDNYAPAGLNSISVLRLASDASRNITGLIGGSTGRLLYIANIGSFNIVLKSLDGGSSSSNQFAIPSDITIVPNQGVQLWYDSISSKWRAFGN